MITYKAERTILGMSRGDTISAAEPDPRYDALVAKGHMTKVETSAEPAEVSDTEQVESEVDGGNPGTGRTKRPRESGKSEGGSGERDSEGTDQGSDQGSGSRKKAGSS